MYIWALWWENVTQKKCHENNDYIKVRQKKWQMPTSQMFELQQFLNKTWPSQEIQCHEFINAFYPTDLYSEFDDRKCYSITNTDHCTEKSFTEVNIKCNHTHTPSTPTPLTEKLCSLENKWCHFPSI